MVSVSLGDMAQSFQLRRQNLGLKQDMTRLSNEMTTGRVADTALRTRGDLMPISSLDVSLARLSGYGAITNEAGLLAGAMQTTLSVIEGLSTDLSAALFSVATGGTAQQVDAVAAEGFQKFDATLKLLNTRLGDRSLFSGIATDKPSVVDTETLLAALQDVVAGLSSPQAIEAGISDWFDSPGGFSALGYLGASAMTAVPISQGEEVAINVTANDAAIRETLKGLAMVALLDRGLMSGQSSDKLEIAKRAGTRLLQSQSDRVDLAARLGLVEARIEAASVRNTHEKVSLQLARNTITGIDPYETISKLEETQAQLEMIYSLTARMTRLSLLDYM